MVFTNAYAGAANCAPSRASLMSGLNTPKHGVYTVGSSERGESKTRKLIPVKNKKYLHDSIYTLPEMLKSAGYKTAHFGKWHIGENPKTQGIDYNIGGSKRGNPGRNGYFSPYNIDFIENKKSDEYLTDRLTSEAINFIKKNYTSPFFINLAFYSVHTPLQGKENLIQKYNLKQGVNGQENSIYGSMVSSVDENIGRILDDNKAQNITSIDLKKKSYIADYLVIAAGTSSRHLQYLSEILVTELKKLGLNGCRIEGRDSNDWKLVDAHDVIVHIFHPEKREFYDLEKMWSEEIPKEKAMI